MLNANLCLIQVYLIHTLETKQSVYSPVCEGRDSWYWSDNRIISIAIFSVFLISFNCFHGNSDTEARSTQTQPTEISRPVGLTEPLSVSLLCLHLSLMRRLYVFQSFCSLAGSAASREDWIHHKTWYRPHFLSPVFCSVYKLALYCFSNAVHNCFSL